MYSYNIFRGRITTCVTYKYYLTLATMYIIAVLHYSFMNMTQKEYYTNHIGAYINIGVYPNLFSQPKNGAAAAWAVVK